MKSLKSLGQVISALLVLGASTNLSALSIKEFASICDSAPMPCHEIPIMQAYVGGALDLVAMLDENTDYLKPSYCPPDKNFLATTPIINFILAHKAERPNRNAMMLLIQYLQENAECDP